MGLIDVVFKNLPFTSTTVPAALILYVINHTAQGNLILAVGAILQILYLVVRFVI